MPGLNVPRNDERRQDEVQQRVYDLGDDELQLARVAVGDDPGDYAEHEEG